MNMNSRIGERGQVTIPKEMRDRLGMVAGNKVAFEERDGEIIMRRLVPKDPLLGLVGLIDERVDVDAYLEETRGPAWDPELDGES